MEQTSTTYTPHFQNFDVPGLLITNFNESPEMRAINHRISIAPMLDYTNVYFRFFMRLLTKHATLYTEMIHENAILNGKGGYKEVLKFNPVEHPVVLQIGGNNPKVLAECARLAQEMGYDEVNINIGCPSSRVQSGAFGACLMKEPDIVSECVLAMKNAVSIPITIKTRLGVDDFDSYEFAYDFIKKTSEKSGCNHYIMHARKAFLKGLNPAENRNIPPLHYDRVLRLKNDFPHLDFSINGGFKTFDSIKEILAPENKLAGCMIGRLCYERPWALADIDRSFYGQKNQGFSRREILEIWADYGQSIMDQGLEHSPFVLTKPVVNLFNGEKNSNKFRQCLSDHQRFKELKNFKAFLFEAAHEFEKVNKVALDERPPLDDPTVVSSSNKPVENGIAELNGKEEPLQNIC